MGKPPKHASGLWNEIQKLTVGAGHTGMWCPSHNKKLQWEPMEKDEEAQND